MWSKVLARLDKRLQILTNELADALETQSEKNLFDIISVIHSLLDLYDRLKKHAAHTLTHNHYKELSRTS